MTWNNVNESISNTDPTRSFTPLFGTYRTLNVDEYNLTNVSAGTTVSIFMGNSDHDEYLQVLDGNGNLVTQNDQHDPTGSFYYDAPPGSGIPSVNGSDALVTFVYQPNYVIRASFYQTTMFGAYTIYSSTGNLVLIGADATAPTVASISSSAANSTYKLGDVISVRVQFSENVNVTGTPQLTLETGSTDRIINYASGSGSDTLTFNYTVQAGDTSADLDYISTTALSLNSGTIKDAAGNNATLTLPTPGATDSLGANKSIVIDGVVPTITNVTSSTANGAYKAGGVVAINIQFSEAVTVTGTPQLTLETGATDRSVNYSSGSGTNTLTFTYTVSAGDTSSDLDYLSTSALALNGGTIKDAAGNNATLTLPTPGAAGSLGANKNIAIDTTAPAITFNFVALSSDTGSSSSDFITATAAQTISATLSVGLGAGDTAYGSLDNGASWTDITAKISGTALTWDGLTLSDSNTLKLKVTDSVGNDSTVFTQAYTIDSTAPSAPSAPDMTSGTDAGNSNTDNITNNTTPTFTGTAESGSTVTLYDSDGTTVLGTTTAIGGNWSITSSTLASGSHILTAKVSDAAGNDSTVSSGLTVTIDTTAPSGLALTDTSFASSVTTSGATLTTLSATDNLAITYAFAIGNGTNDANNSLFAITGNSLKVAGAALTAGTYRVYLKATDVAGNIAYHAATITVIDAPTVVSIVRAGGASATVAGSATSIDYTATFSESVTGVGTPDFSIVPTGTASGEITSISGTGTTYTITIGNLAGDGTLRLDLNGAGTGIQNGSSVAIAGGYTSGQTYTLDHTAPSAPSTPDMTAGTDTGASNTDNLTGNNTPTFAGTAESGSTVTLYDSDGTTVLGTTTATGGNWSITSSTLPTGDHTLTAKATDAAGNVSSASAGLTVTVDTNAPTVTSVQVPSNGTYKTGDNLDFTVNFSENVTITGTPQLAIDIGGITKYATYQSGSGTSSPMFRYIVESGLTDSNGITVNGTIDANGGTFKDMAGNSATLTLNSVGATTAVLVDAIAPTVNSVSVPANATYKIGDTLSFTLNFNEAVMVNSAGGTPQLALDIGGTTKYATYQSGSGTNALVFNYALENGLVDSDGIGVSSLSTNGGSLKDAAGNNATLTLNSVGATTNVLVDSTAPTVSGVTSSTANGTYKAGDVIAVNVQFSENVTVTGTPQLTLETGTTDQLISYASGSGANTLTFNYTVQAGDTTVDLDYLSTAALALNGGTIKDAAGNNATLTLAAPGTAGSLGANKAIVIDTLPAITSATYDAATGTLAVAGKNLEAKTGAANDIDVSKLAVVGEGGGSYTLTSANVEIASATAFTVTLNATDKAAVNQILNKNGTTSTGGTTFNLAAAEDWATGTNAAFTIADLAGNGITVSNVAAPSITSAKYETETGVLTVTGTGFLKLAGAGNDIDVSKLTLKGQGSATRTLTSANVEISSDTGFQVTLNTDDRTALATLFNKDGLSATDSTAYNLAAAEDWAAGADPAVNVADVTNTVTVTLPPVDTGTSAPTTTTSTVDGVALQTSTTTAGDGTVQQTIVIPVVTPSRPEVVGNNTVADIPLIKDSSGASILTAQVPTGIGLQVTGSSAPRTAGTSLTDLIREIQAHTDPGSQDQTELSAGGSGFLQALPSDAPLLVQTIVPTAGTGNAAPTEPLVISGKPNTPGAELTALVIDTRGLPPGTGIQLQDVEFAAIIGNVHVTGGAGSQHVWGDSASQTIYLGADDDELHGGAGDDTVGSAGGNDRLFGDSGNDLLFGGMGQDLIAGGAGNDTVSYTGKQADYKIERNGKLVTVRSLADASDVDTLVNIETIQFADGNLVLDDSTAPAGIAQLVAGLYAALYSRAPDLAGLQYWMNEVTARQLDVRSLASLIADHAKFDQLYAPALTSAEFVSRIYQNILGIDGDAAGKQFWANWIDAGLSRADFVGEFVSAALNFDAAKSTTTGTDLANATKANSMLNNKVDVALHFAAALASKSNGAVDSTAYQNAVAVLAGVSDSSQSIEDAIVKIDLIGGHTGFGSAVIEQALLA